MSKLISIIIPFYNYWLLTYQRLTELQKYCSGDVEIVLVNDASTDSDCRTGAGFWQKLSKEHWDIRGIKYVENKENLGFGGSHNRGAKAAEGDILVFLSNDVVIKGEFLSQIREAINNYDGEVIIGGRILYDDTGWNTLPLFGGRSIVPYPEGWLIACTREMWDRIGGFDPIYSPYDFEDCDIGAWATYNRVPMVGLNTSLLQHLGGATIYKVNPEREKVTIRNQEKFIGKWTEKFTERFA